MVKKIKNTKKELKPLVLELEMELLNVEKALGKLETSVGILQTGDKNGAYWNGANAYSFLKSCMGQIDHNHHLLDELNGCFDYLDSVCRKN